MSIRRFSAVALTAVVVGISLVGCSADSAEQASCDASLSGDLSESVSASGTVGDSVTDTSFPTPMVTEQTQATVLEQGDGDALSDSSAWSIAYTLYAGTSTEAVESVGYPGSTSSTSAVTIEPSAYADSWPGLATALSCGHVGDRIAIVMGTVDNADFLESSGLGSDSSPVMIVDVVDGFGTRAEGSSQSVASVFPTVTLATDGQPGISTPEGTAPEDTTIGVLIKGDGETVAAEDTVVVQYSGWLWSDGTQFSTSWGSGQFLEAAQDSVIDGFWKAVEGQTVGSQVIVIVPAKDGYGDTESSSIPANSTLIFVIDILAVR